ncbi:hexokinase 2 ASCRUDRAFT_75550 [Ascoidea rubescens DSM 1968]|uniref:Phosphotransferase n=1 Tax=Ascoidea rubescens DSM 1968 TaxID=1344418 RepID=A0A1D2VIV8_9ASCO|nr:hypothetical protein ASCRUDRAFT_75550 [Ascoidea rubescens DSM 1968]ODV61558.1 hypothetical protein ASCRUDRAFT_75550 [Ascoidea rubescens DSM 1968]
MVHLGPKKPQHRKGSMMDVPRDLIEEIKVLKSIFSVSPAKLRQITDHFRSELEKGLSVNGGNIPMIPTWVLDYPTGKESGSYLAIDLGGTNLRVVLVNLLGNRDFDTTQSKYSLPRKIRTATADELFDFIATSIQEFLHEQYPDGCKEEIPLGFTFSYPATQSAINTGLLQRWTKGYDIKNVENHDVVPMLQKALKQKNLPITVVALINDTTGTLVASHYTDPKAEMGLIFGTGCNGAYYELIKNVPKLQKDLPKDISPDSPIAINCEYGAFDNEHKVLPRTKYDIIIDEQSPRPGQQSFEKMISGYYLGELLRLVMLDLHQKGLLFENQSCDKLKIPFHLDTSFPAKIEEDPFENLSDVKDLILDELNIHANIAERKLIRTLAELIGTRASRLSICAVAAIYQKRGFTKTVHAAADGSVFNKYPDFQSRATQALADIFDWKMPKDQYPIVLVPAEDGSGAGAAIIAALTENRIEAGLSIGL